MRIFSVILILLIIAGAIFIPQVFFKVDETEVALVTRFGEIKSQIQTPGLNVKTPFIDKVTKYEKRLLLFDAPPDSLLTKDKK